MTAQPPLALAPGSARLIGEAAAIVEDDDGGRVFVHGNLAYAWDAGDAAGRRLAAVSLVRIKAVTQRQVAEAFAVTPLAVRRWAAQYADAGVAGLLPEHKGPKRKSKLIDTTVAAIHRLRETGASLRAVAAATGVSEGSVRNALKSAGADVDKDEPCAPTGSDDPLPQEQEQEQEADVEAKRQIDVGPVFEVDAGGEDGCAAAACAVAAAPAVGVPVLADPLARGAERVAARFGLLESAPPVFTPCARAPLAGLLLALPALAASGLLETAHEVYGELPNGFYSLDTMLCEGVFRALLGQARAEGATRIDPVALGRVLGLDRAPEVKTIRRKIGLLAKADKADDWITAMARRHVEACPEQAAVCYVDGHVRAYQGSRKIAKTHVPRLKFPAPATVETWVSDAAGDPLLVVMAEPAASLAGELRRLMPELRALVGDDRRVLVGFDRGGWSPTLFADLHAAGFDTLTWRKGRTADIDEACFSEHSHTDEHGRVHTWRLADTPVALDITEGPRKGEVFTMRQISLWDCTRTRQMHILTTRADLPAAEIRYRMGSPWRQENHYRYARIHFDLDSHDTYRVGDDDAERMVPNPAKKIAYQQVEKARRALLLAETLRDRDLLTASCPPPGATAVLTNSMIDTINADVHAAQDRLDAALTAHQEIPARLPLAQVNPGQQVLDTETKLIHHAIRIAAYNTTRSLASAIITDTGYARADDEAHTLIRTALARSGDIIPDHRALHIRLDPLPTPRQTAAIADLCQALNDTDTIYPGTTLTLRYSVKPHPGPHTN
ncbi:MAG TPA: helix-turn-helix domain-containing protein [Candidatus Baltobacteraceae bacterium]|nr:helix-turn-helix domain-containing protein [Candidatus Baltobacteraceae bacterium]